tara:strand:- start:7607 stop:8074 length:468 start_codon:yes stop_codon:yes gene_type:complete
MEVRKPKAVSCYPPYGGKIMPFPDDLSPKELMSNDRVYLYNPFVNGQRFLPKSPNAVTLHDLKNHFIVDEAGNMDIGVKSSKVQAMYKSLDKAWNSILDYVSQQLATEVTLEPKKRGNRFKLTPEDIKAIVSKPNQALKPKGPTNSPKLAPPKPR